MTLVELLVASALMIGLLASVTPVFTGVLNN